MKKEEKENFKFFTETCCCRDDSEGMSKKEEIGKSTLEKIVFLLRHFSNASNTICQKGFEIFMNKRSIIFFIVYLLLVVFFLTSTVLQLNDDDWYIYLIVYFYPALSATFVLTIYVHKLGGCSARNTIKVYRALHHCLIIGTFFIALHGLLIKEGYMFAIQLSKVKNGTVKIYMELEALNNYRELIRSNYSMENIFRIEECKEMMGILISIIYFMITLTCGHDE
ncbi:hypothetical protein SNEBB_005644 [Seison nebaliae]|nr:hypothetical protein SNEBB_005644 [Seison nebaliae]